MGEEARGQSAPLEQILLLEQQREALRVLLVLLVGVVRVLVPNARAAPAIETRGLEAQHRLCLALLVL